MGLTWAVWMADQKAAGMAAKMVGYWVASMEEQKAVRKVFYSAVRMVAQWGVLRAVALADCLAAVKAVKMVVQMAPQMAVRMVEQLAAAKDY